MAATVVERRVGGGGALYRHLIAGFQLEGDGAAARLLDRDRTWQGLKITVAATDALMALCWGRLAAFRACPGARLGLVSPVVQPWWAHPRLVREIHLHGGDVETAAILNQADDVPS